jgi:hypothetical protein
MNPDLKIGVKEERVRMNVHGVDPSLNVRWPGQSECAMDECTQPEILLNKG